MATRLKAVLPLIVSVGVLAFVATWLSLNFTFHWVTVQDGVFGKYGLPEGIHLVLPAIFVTWGLFFMIGADNPAIKKTLVAAFTGCLGATITIIVGPLLADSPDFWGLGVMIGVTAALLVVLSTVVEDDLFAAAPAFGCYAATFFWWIATGLDNFVPDGKGPRTVEAITAAITDKPLSAGTGAFGGLLSMPWQWVSISVFASLVVGTLFGVVSVHLAGALGRIGARRTAPTSSSDPGVAAGA